MVNNGVLSPIFAYGGDGNDSLHLRRPGRRHARRAATATTSLQLGPDVHAGQHQHPRRRRRRQHRRQQPRERRLDRRGRRQRHDQRRHGHRRPSDRRHRQRRDLRQRPERHDQRRRRRRHGDRQPHADDRPAERDRRRHRLEHARHQVSRAATTSCTSRSRPAPTSRSTRPPAARSPRRDFHEVDLNLLGGKDTIAVDTLKTRASRSLSVDAGSGDHALDTLTLNGAAADDDTFTVSGNDATAGVEIVHTIIGRSSNGQVYFKSTSKTDNDALVINGDPVGSTSGGNDTIDASSLGTSSTGTGGSPTQLLALTITAARQRPPDRLAVQRRPRRRQGQRHDDRRHRTRQFFDANTPADGFIDTLIETQNTDMGLFGDTFIAGTILNDNGNGNYAYSLGGLDGRERHASNRDVRARRSVVRHRATASSGRVTRRWRT